MAPIRWEKWLLWLLWAAVAGLGVGQLAAWVGGYIRPLAVFPLLVGSLLGGMLVAGIRLLDLAHRGSILMGLVLANLVGAGSEHWGCYRQAQRDYERAAADWQAKTEGLAALSSQFAQAIQQQLPPPPGSFINYLLGQLERGRQIGPWRLQGPWVWASWLLDAGLALLAAAALVWTTLRWPYCTTCQTWYRTIRQGRLLPTDFARWSEVLHIPAPQPEPAARFRSQFRLLQCLGQCTPGRLELVWETPEGQLQSWQGELDLEKRRLLDTLWQSSPPEQEPAPNPNPSP